MHAELCRVRTDDGLLLDGSLSIPADEKPSTLPVDAFLLIHGTGSNFYAPGMLKTFAGQAVAAGVSVLRVNTRGHDQMASISGANGTIRGGAAYETIAECCHDLNAWLDFLVGRNFERIALVGHSMGAVKSIYSQAKSQHPAVQQVIAISPPRFCHQQLTSHRQGADFRDDFTRAQQLVADGKGDALITVRQPLPLTLTAAGFLAKYGPHDEYDIIRHLPQMNCPVLIVIGTESVAASPAFYGLPDEVQQLAAEHPQIALELVDGANTGYTTRREIPFLRTAAWLSQFQS